MKISMELLVAIVFGNTLVPGRAIAESFDCEVNWYENTKVVEILSEF